MLDFAMTAARGIMGALANDELAGPSMPAGGLTSGAGAGDIGTGGDTLDSRGGTINFGGGQLYDNPLFWPAVLGIVFLVVSRKGK